MSENDGAGWPRRLVIDVSAGHEEPRKRRRRSRRNARPQVTITADQQVLHSHTSGVPGAMALREIADRLRALGPMGPQLDSIILDAERRSQELINAWAGARR